MKDQTSIVVRTSFVALHAWPDCPFEEVAFLRYPHRHVFFVELKMGTTTDRQIEFIMMKNQLTQFLLEHYEQKDLGCKSCEVMAEEIASFLGADFVSVFEDNENGAEYYRCNTMNGDQ